MFVARSGLLLHTLQFVVAMLRLLLLLVALTTRAIVIIDAASPISIGIRSAIARRPTNLPRLSSSRRHASFPGILQTCNTGGWISSSTTTKASDDDLLLEIHDEQTLADIRGGGSSVAIAATAGRRLQFWEAMICGAVSRSAAQTIMHPANTMKTILQSSRKVPGQKPLNVLSFTQWKYARTLTRGAGAQLILSIPHGAVNFAVLELVRRQMNNVVSRSKHVETMQSLGPVFDFLSSAMSTICCSVVSTPQMMICDNIMAGTYPNLYVATKSLMKDRGFAGFYTGWWPGIAGKIPSYGLTWTLFEQVKRVRSRLSHRPATDVENSIMGCIASATTVCIMIPMDTVKTRLVTQMRYPDLAQYAGINDCFRTVLKEEGIGAFYRGLTPRLLSVVPMIGIQFGVYEFMKKFMTSRDANTNKSTSMMQSYLARKSEMKMREEEAEREKVRKGRLLQEMAMEVAADDDQPFPAPYPKTKDWWAGSKKLR